MAELQIPSQYQGGFKTLLNLDQDEVSNILHILDSIPPNSNKQEYIDQISNNSDLSSEEANKVVSMLFSLYYLKYGRRESLRQTVKDLYTALVESGEEDLIPSDDKAQEFQDNLLKLLSLDDTLGIKVAAKKLGAAFERIYCRSEIITDLRPVHIDEKIDHVFGLVVHNLKLEFHKAPEFDEREVIVRLDKEDLELLRKQIVRAEKKEELIRSKFGEVVKFMGDEGD